MAAITLRALSADDLAAAVPLLGMLNSSTPQALVHERLATMLSEHSHYHLVGAFLGSKLVGVSGAWIATKVWCGRYLEIDNIVVDPEHRSEGVGSLLIGHFETIAREQDCKLLVLDSYTSNHPSHRLYHRLGFEIWGFHFIKPIGDYSGAPSS